VTPANVASVIRQAHLRVQNSTVSRTCTHPEHPFDLDILKIDIGEGIDIQHHR
jgi:hypothetical protein